MIGKAQDVATYYPSGNLAPILPPSSTVCPRAIAYGVITIRGMAYGIPYNAFYQGVFYNKDLFENTWTACPHDAAGSLGARGDAQGPPHRAICRPFRGDLVRREHPHAVRHRERLQHHARLGRQVPLPRGGIFQLTGDAGCFAAVREILDETWTDAMSIDQTECDDRFARGEAAMYVTGSWTLQNIDGEKPHIRVGIFPFPGENGDARLIFEPNMTFMKSSRTSHAEAVDQVLHVIFESKDLASEIFDFTKTSSLLKNIGPEVPLLIQSDIDSYLKAGRVVDATTGNGQLIWSFQEKVASRMVDWLQGRTSLDAVLSFADQNRSLSAP